MKTGPNIVTDGLVFAIDSYSNIRGFTKFGTSGTNNSHRAIRNLVDKSTTYSLSDTSQLTGGNYFTLYALTYPESSQTPASRHGITAGFNNTSATKLYSHSRDLGYYVFDESTNTWVADSYFNGERISGHVYDTYDGEPDQHQKFQDDYDTIKTAFPNATHIVIGSHASENVDNDADTVTRLKEIGLPDDAVGLGRVEFVLAGKVNKPHTHHYVRENVSSTVAHMNLRLPLEGVGGSMIFDGTDDYIDIGSDDVLDVGSMTQEVIYQPLGINRRNPIIADNNPVGSDYAHAMWLEHYNDNKLLLIFGDGSTHGDVSSTATITDTTKYHHIVCVRDASAKTVEYFINGVSDGVKDWANKASIGNPIIYDGSTSALSYDHYIGGHSSFSKSYAKIPVVKIYNRTLSTTEVKQNFNAYRKRFGI